MNEKIKKVNLTRPQILTDIGAELVAICCSITQDGSLTETEIKQLNTWLDVNREKDIPALEYLSITIKRIISDGRVSQEELREIYKTIESILPPEIRNTLIFKRKEIEKKQKEEEKSLKLKNEPIASARFMIAGVHYENRAAIIQTFVREDEKVFLIRDPDNPYSPYAIKILIKNGLMIGFVPEEYVMQLSKYLDEGYPHKAYVLRIYIGHEANFPLIQVFIMRKESDIPGLIFPQDIPQETNP